MSGKKKPSPYITYTDDLAEQICLRISQGESLLKICKSEDMPNYSSVMRWIQSKDDFRNNYARAKEIYEDYIFELIREVAENQEIGETVKESVSGDHESTEITRADMIAHRRLKIDSYKWMLGKMRPKKYGDKIEVDSTIKGTIDNKIEIVTKSDIDHDDIGFKES
jgi:hypothetical protein